VLGAAAIGLGVMPHSVFRRFLQIRGSVTRIVPFNASATDWPATPGSRIFRQLARDSNFRFAYPAGERRQPWRFSQA
jgi:hypothetical protein